MRGAASPNVFEIADIAEIAFEGSGLVTMRVFDRDRREWIAKLSLDVLDRWLRRISLDDELDLRAETPGDHARVRYPKRAWELVRDAANREPTFSCRTADGCGIEIGFNIDQLTAAPTVAITVAAG
jgi:hypothetical protein